MHLSGDAIHPPGTPGGDQHSSEVKPARPNAMTAKSKGTGDAPVVTVRLPHELTRQIDQWAKANGEETRSHAIRRLLGMAWGAPKRRDVAGGARSK
jgi:ribbon-helix-helix CopG family protein